MQVTKWDLNNLPTTNEKEDIIEFLYTNLEQYGDEKEDISKCLAYVFNELNNKQTSGFVIVAFSENQLVGVTVVNETGMSGFIPENILVYIATHKNFRGKGIGKLLMQTVLKEAKGDIALHVEPNNPAKKLYEKLGFTNKYLEMRYKK